MSSSHSKMVILSDLHLWGPEDPLYRALIHFIQDKLSDGDKFFIVGDLFDLFIGNKQIFRDRYKDLIQSLKNLEKRNIETFYIEGNHDFHLENLFEDCPHIRLYSDSLHYEWDGRKFHFAHGDKINWKDVGYQLFRAVTRSLVGQCITEAIPGPVLDKIGKTMSTASRGYHPAPNEQVVRLFRNYACDQISNGYDFVVMGHSHYLDEMRFRVDSHEGQYVNVGYPRKHKKYLELTQGAPFFKLLSWEDLVVPTRPVTENLSR